MTRAAWLTAVALITGTLTAILVRALMDTRVRAVAEDTGVQFSSMSVGGGALTPVRANGVDLTPIGSETVPAGREFVILQVHINALADSGALSSMQLESRFPKPNHERSPIVLERLALAHPENTDRIYTLKFPDGSVVVDSGRMPWVSTQSIEDGAEEREFPPVSILGYYRVKQSPE